MARSDARSPSGPALDLDKVCFHWPGARGFGIEVGSFIVGRGEHVLLLGESGAGKSTLLSLVCGVVAPQAGKIAVLGEDITCMGATARDRFRAEHFGIIFQMFNLLPYANAIDNALLPLGFAAGRRQRATAQRSAAAEAARLLAALGIEGELAKAGAAAELSIGQQQRVAAARALIGAPEIVIADEPTSALDSRTQEKFLDLLFGQLGETGSTLVMVSHDERLAGRFNRVVRIGDIAHVTGEKAA